MKQERLLQKFIDIYRKQYNEEISEDEATKLASQIIEIYRAVFGDPLISSDNHNKKNE